MKAIPYTDEQGNQVALILGDSNNGWNMSSNIPKLVEEVKFELPEVLAELINDSLIDGVRDGRWETEVKITYPPTPPIMSWTNRLPLPSVRKSRNQLQFEYYADGFSLAVLDNVLYVKHLAGVEVDGSADLITDADKLIALLDWIYEGGQFPLTKERGTENE